MNGRGLPPAPYRPEVGCFLLLAALALLCLLPLVLFEAAEHALRKLHLPAWAATGLVLGMLLGGLVNLPLRVWERDEPQATPQGFAWTLLGWTPVYRRDRLRTVLAVNVGGCLIPAALAIYQAAVVLSEGPVAASALLLAVVVNVAACRWLSQPVPGVGIVMPAFVPPALAVGAAWLLLSGESYALIRAPLAYVAGVAGPLIGADLLRLPQLRRLNAQMVSIGGAGTFDGIVLSGLLAALLA